jgi:mannose-6-phosphate isomerase-like protein (cupin superfamily)
MMNRPRIEDMSRSGWQPHPTIEGVLTKVFENRATHALADVLMARVEVSGAIPWHVHDQASETAYILSGAGILKYRQDEDGDLNVEAPLRTGVVLTIPAGWWHQVLNTGDRPLELFAFHTPPTI